MERYGANETRRDLWRGSTDTADALSRRGRSGTFEYLDMARAVSLQAMLEVDLLGTGP